MPKLNHIAVTALKDNVRVVTARKKLPYRKVEGLEGKGMPEGQEEVYDQEHGLTLQLDQTIEIDVTDAQMAEFQKAVDAGDLEVVVHETPAAPVAKQLAPTAKETAKPVEDPKGGKQK